MTKCQRCEIDFPNKLVHPMQSSEGTWWLCGVCALEIRNKMHGLPMDTPFTGTEAQHIYKATKRYLQSRN